MVWRGCEDPSLVGVARSKGLEESKDASSHVCLCVCVCMHSGEREISETLQNRGKQITSIAAWKCEWIYNNDNSA